MNVSGTEIFILFFLQTLFFNTFCSDMIHDFQPINIENPMFPSTHLQVYTMKYNKTVLKK